MNSKSSRSFSNLISAILKGVVTSLLGFILTPFIIKYVGDESFGLFKIMIDWLSNVWMFDLGVSGAFLSVAAVYYSKSDRKQLFGDGFKKYIKALPLLFLSCIAFYFITFSLVRLNEVTFYDYTLSFSIISLTFLFYPLNTFRQYYEVSERASFVNFITILQLLLTNLFTFLLAYLGMGLLGLSLCYAFFIAVGFIYIFYRCIREEKWKIKDLLNTKGEYDKYIKKDGKNFLFINISQKISFLADNSIIAYFYSPAAIVPFFVSQRLASLFQTQIQGIGFSGWASLVDFYNKGRTKIFKLRLIETLKMNLLLSFGSIIVIWVLNKPFIYLWIGSDYYIDDSFSVIVSLLAFINTLNFFLGNILSGTGHVQKQSKAYITTGVLNLGMSIILTYFLGFHGPVLASLITMFTLLIFKLNLMVKVYKIRVLTQLKVFVPQLLISSIFILGIDAYILNNSISTWFELFSCASLIIVFYTLIVFSICFTPEEKSTWINRLRRILKL